MTNGDEGHSRPAKFFYWWADRSLLQLLLVAAVSLPAVVGYVQPDYFRELLAGEAVEVAVSQVSSSRPAGAGRGERSRRGAGDSADEQPVEPFRIGGGDVVLVATGDGFFTAEGITAMRRAVRRLEELPQVQHVLWLDRVPNLNLFGLSDAALPPENASPRQFEAARQQALSNPLTVGQFISADGQTMVLHLRLDWFFARSDAAVTTQLRETAVAAVREVPGADIDFAVTGPIPLDLMMAQSHMQNARKYQAIGYSIMLLSALVLFRGLAAVIIVAFAPAVGVFWTMGWLALFDLQDNPFNDIIVPVLISLVGLTDSVHLMVEIRNRRASGLSALQAARVGLSRVAPACWLTSLTTAIGFISLTFAHHSIVREFGWCCVLGVGMTLASVLTVVPLLCRSPLGRRLHVGVGSAIVDRHLRRTEPLVDWGVRHDRLISAAAIVGTALLAAISLQLEPDEKRYSGLSESGEAAVALRHLDRSLGGLEFAQVQVRWLESTDEGEVLQVLEAVHGVLADEPLLGHPLGLRDLIAALPGEGPPEERMTMLELLPPALKRAFYHPEKRTAQIQFRVQDLGIAKYGPVFTRIENSLAAITQQHPSFDLTLEGNAAWRWRNVYRVVTDLATSLGTAGVVIWIVLTLAFRSLRLGLISLVPNLFPLAVTGSALVLTGQHLELVTVCVFTICIGIAVDDTIHFLSRYREEAHAGGDHASVLRRAFGSVGTALLMTTIVLVAGMGTAIIGDARDARLFGIMGCFTLVAALFADLLLLPALLSRFGRGKPATNATAFPIATDPSRLTE